MVELGGEVPSWGISRWDSPGLRVVPADDEGFSVRGDKRRLLYKGRKRSHRFTILGDNSFEYDCILNKEPESNTVMLALEGAENYDFFRQPDWLKNPLLAGSYAVYKKENLIGEGTGKLCHIHRPKIIDSRGRWVWGDLSIAGDMLCITIPENWLSEARYPVVVDPVIGTAMVGSQTLWDADPEEPWVPLYNEACIPVNRYPVHETINGLCTAYYYVYSDAEPDSAGYPVFYSDQNNKPFQRRSRDEGYIDLQVAGGKPPGWRSGTLRSDGAIPAGTNLWFGISTEMFWYAAFDYGSTLYTGDYNFDDLLPDTYMHYTWNDFFNDFRLSMYFEYTSAQNYVRTLYQGVTLNDTRKLTGDYKRALVMNTDGTSFLGHASEYYRKHSAGVQSTDTTSRLRGFYRAITEKIKITDVVTYCRDFLRVIGNMIRPCTGETRKLDIKRKIETEAGILDNTARQRGFIRTLFTAVDVQDYAGKFLTWLRVIRHGAAAFDRAGHWGDYLRGLYVEAGSRAETIHSGEYYRFQQDHVSTQALSLRHLVIFIRLVTVGLVRDFLIERFLKAREELVLKSGLCREIILESNIH